MDTLERRKRKTIVVVNDSPEVLSLMKDLLEDEGYRTVATDQATEAYRLIKEMKPSLVILDALMTDVPRWHVLDLIKLDPATTSIPVLVCSGTVWEGQTASWLRERGCEILPKPFNLDDLLTKVALLVT